jgi:RimJ/RimL family protein N-acetyltransferase
MSLMLKARPLSSGQVVLEPLRPRHAAELAPVLADPALYRYIGGEPPNLAELRSRFDRQSTGASPDGHDAWLNWVIRTPDTHTAAGTMQVTIRDGQAPPVAEVAWVVGSAYQRRGLAKAAACLVVDWLHEHGVVELCAHVNSENHPSAAVAASIGLSPTRETRDGEQVWRSAP